MFLAWQQKRHDILGHRFVPFVTSWFNPIPVAWTSLCDLSELTEGQAKYVEIDGYRLAVFLHGGRPYVIDNTCPHAGGDMSTGFVDGDGCAVCPWHGWAFHLNDGQLRGMPGVTIRTYTIRLYEHQGRQLVQADLPAP